MRYALADSGWMQSSVRCGDQSQGNHRLELSPAVPTFRWHAVYHTESFDRSSGTTTDMIMQVGMILIAGENQDGE